MRCENSTLLCISWPKFIYVNTVNTKCIHTFLSITFLIFNRFSICKKFWKAETEGFSTIPSILYMSILLTLGISIANAFNAIYVTAVGWRAGNTRFTFVLARVGPEWCMRQVITATWSSITVMNTISTLMGGHALVSPKGGRPCSLGTFNYGVTDHLAFRINLNTLIGPSKRCQGTQIWDMTIPGDYGATEKQQSK